MTDNYLEELFINESKPALARHGGSIEKVEEYDGAVTIS